MATKKKLKAKKKASPSAKATKKKIAKKKTAKTPGAKKIAKKTASTKTVSKKTPTKPAKKKSYPEGTVKVTIGTHAGQEGRIVRKDEYLNAFFLKLACFANDADYSQVEFGPYFASEFKRL